MAIFNWLTRQTIYIRLSPHWIVVRVLKANHPPLEYADRPWVVVKQTAKDSDSFPQVVAVGQEAENFPLDSHSGLDCINGFDHPRSIIHDFEIAALTLQKFIQKASQVSPQFQVQLAPRIILQPLAKVEGGLTKLEKQTLLAIGNWLGASEAHVWEDSRLLSDDELLNRYGEFSQAS